MNIFSINRSFKRAYYSNKKTLFLILTTIFVGALVFGTFGFPTQASACCQCPPPPVCEPNPEADLTGEILHLTGMATATNTSELCSYDVGLAVYEKFDENIDNQELFDSDLKVIGPDSSINLEVELPDCAYQIDLFYGELIESFAGGVRYGDRKLDWEHNNSGGYCFESCCGDGVLDQGEQCDDGNNTDGDGCSADCQIEEGLCEEGEALVETYYDSKPTSTYIDNSTNDVSNKLCNSTYLSVDTSNGVPHYIYMNWDDLNISEYDGVLSFNLLLNHKESSTEIEVELKNNSGNWVDVCNPPESGSFTWDTCDLMPYLNILEEVDDIELRVVAQRTGNCHEYLKCAKLQVELYDCEATSYCGDGNLDQGEECEIGHDCGCGYLCNLDTCLCEALPPEPLTIFAYKVVCESEEDLPNWATAGTQAGEPSVITSSTAIEYVENSEERCWLEPDWDFQWGLAGEAQKQAGDHIGPAPDGTGWHDFDLPTSTTSPAEVYVHDIGETLRIWVRENLKENYISFANPPGNVQDDISAELLCHDDILNFDNYDYIRNPQLGSTYYCVAFNSLIPEPPEPYCGDGNLDQGEECEIGHDCGCGYLCNLDTCLCELEPPEPFCGDGNLDSGEECEIGYECNCPPDSVCNLQTCLCEPEAPQPFCGDGNLDQGEECDDGQDNGVECNPDYGSSCNFCSLSCDIIELQGGYCGDGVISGPEDCEINEDCCPGMSCVECSCYTPITYFISGLKFNDKNNNSIKDCCVEPGLEEWVITIEGPYQFDDSTTTDGEGRYEFPGLIPGGYTICEESQMGWEQTYPLENEGCHIIEIIDGSISEVNFGNHQLPYCGDGNLDAGEECEIGHECDCGYTCDFQTCLCEELPGPSCEDNDQDGYYAYDEGYCLEGDDCDDTNPLVNPGAVEVCDNQIDDDCDGDIDCDDSDCTGDPACQFPQPECTPQATTTCSTGQSGICSSGIQTCSQEGFWGECEQDNEPVTEICNNGLDDDCDGLTDCDDGDCEGDPYCGGGPQPPICTPGDIRACGTGLLGICSSGIQTCNSEGFWSVCAQNNEPVTEICNNSLDDDCDGATDCSDSDCMGDPYCYIAPPGPICMDLDSDGYNAYASYCLSGTDCDDSNPNINPGVSEVCNNQIDDDCDGDIDCQDSDCMGDASCGSGGPVCTDLDGDGYAIEGDVCGPSDCDDSNPNINPGVSEICNNSLDDDCDGDVDCDDGDCEGDPYCEGGPQPPTCTQGDTRVCSTGLLGICSSGIETCNSEGSWSVCEQNNQLVSEICNNSLDDDCDGDIDCGDSDCVLDPYCMGGGDITECEPGNQQSCDTDFMGICSVGTQTCDEEGFWGDCLADYEASFEICDNGLDDDCDGDADCDDSDCSGVIYCTGGGGEEEEEVGFFGAALAQAGNFFSNLLASVIDSVSGLLGFLTNGKDMCLCLPSCFPWWIIFIIFLYSVIRTIKVWNKDNKETRTWLVWALILLILTVCFLFKIFVCLTFWTLVILMVCTYLIHRSLKQKEEDQTYKLFE